MVNKKQSELLTACLSDLHNSLSDKLEQVKDASKHVSENSSSEIERFITHELIELRRYYASQDKKLRECYRSLKNAGASAQELNQVVATVKKIDELHSIANNIIKESEESLHKKEHIMR